MNAVPHEHISNAIVLKNMTFTTSASGDTSIYTPDHSEFIWVVYYAHMIAVGVTNQTVLIKSGSTTIARYWQQGIISQSWPKTFEFDGHPIWIADAAGDVMKINLSAASQYDGFMVIGEMPPRGVQ